MSTVDLLDRVYADVAGLAAGLDETTSWRPTGCPGWAARDLVFHLLGDAQRALVALADPGADPPDRTAATYWLDSPGRADPESRGLRSLRTMASAWRLDHLVDSFAETSRAAVALARRADPRHSVRTQGHVLEVEDFLLTLVVEAVVHQLDLLAGLDGPPPDEDGVALTASVLDSLLGRPPGDGGTSWVLLGTGRRPPGQDDLAWLGADATRLPLLG